MTLPKRKNPLSLYTPTMDQAIGKLHVALSFADDWAQLDAIRCASEAITLLVQAKAQRDVILAGQPKEQR